jgi:hypothetical protein
MDKTITDFHKPDMYHNIGLCTQTIYDGLKMKSAGFIVERVAATNHLRNVHSGMFQIESPRCASLERQRIWKFVNS